MAHTEPTEKDLAPLRAAAPPTPAAIPQLVIDRVVTFMCERENIPLDALNAEQQANLRAEAADLIRAVHGIIGEVRS